LWGQDSNYDGPLEAWDFRFLTETEEYNEFNFEGFNIGGEWAYGSYGKNVYISSADLIEPGNFDYSWWYRTIYVAGTDEIPLFGDCNYTGGFPYVFDEPAENRLHGPVDGDNLNRWNLDRHNKAINMLFLDWSVRKVGLRELWMLKWSRQTVMDGGEYVCGWGNLNTVPDPDVPEAWPEWMRD
jgi:prepilin-type processing-associated H-X9-DG protein